MSFLNYFFVGSVSFFIFSCAKVNTRTDACSTPKLYYAYDSCSFYLPNIFSPNGDGLNDIFSLYCDCQVTDFKLEVFSLNKTYFSSTNPTDGWDGNFNNKEAKEGVYQYTVKGNFGGLNLNETQTITLIRDTENPPHMLHCSECSFVDQEFLNCQ